MRPLLGWFLVALCVLWPVFVFAGDGTTQPDPMFTAPPSIALVLVAALLRGGVAIKVDLGLTEAVKVYTEASERADRAFFESQDKQVAGLIRAAVETLGKLGMPFDDHRRHDGDNRADVS